VVVVTAATTMKCAPSVAAPTVSMALAYGRRGGREALRVTLAAITTPRCVP